ncbi:hypothetical protein [Olivibacter sp. SDN3]|uniref:hypothetical protein n=1 Tax=Olivibacter sp. SDN3 TaxID=2764720 RepID=UPI001C9E4188|nr:hypothetical protein [Olivibacter sp. SDN3]
MGIVVGTLAALLMGYLPIWFGPIHIIGSIGLGWLLISVYLRYTDRRLEQLTSTHQANNGKATPARIDNILYAGIRMVETRDLMIIDITVFPESGEPYATTIRQFLTVEELEPLEVGTIIAFYEDKHDPGYGIVTPKQPVEAIGADIETFKAEKIYPERRKTGLLLLIGRNPNVFKRSVSMVLIFATFGFGFLAPFMATGNMDWLRMYITYFPQKLVFQYKGNFNPEMSEKAYERAIAYIGERRIESVLFYKDYTMVRVEHAAMPGSVSSVTIRGNSVDAGFMSLMEIDTARLFTVDAIRYDVLKKALDDASTDHDLSDISYIGFRKDTRRGARIQPGYKQHHIDIHIVFKGGKKSLDYHGKTGTRLPR